MLVVFPAVPVFAWACNENRLRTASANIQNLEPTFHWNFEYLDDQIDLNSHDAITHDAPTWAQKLVARHHVLGDALQTDD